MGRGIFGSEFQIGNATVRKVDFITPEVDKACLLIATEGFGRSANALQQTVEQHIRDGDLYVAYQNNEPAGFRIVQYPRSGVAYLAGAIKRPGSQRHLIRDMTQHIVRNSMTNVVVTRTGSDFVLDEMVHLCEDVFPYNATLRDPKGFLTTLKLERIITLQTKSDTLFIPECYGGSPMINESYGRPRSQNSAVAECMRRLMSDEEYLSGGAVALIGTNLR